MNHWKELSALCRQLGCCCKCDEPMSLHTTFQIGGPADAFVDPSQESQIAAILQFAKQKGIPWRVVGKGSNLLVNDAGYRGLIIHLGEAFSAMALKGDTMIEAQAGASLAQLCWFAYEHGLTGLEFAWGIPGSVGGAVYMNAGAYQGEMQQVVRSVHHLDCNGRFGEYELDELDFSYRHSIYHDVKHTILSTVVQLSHGDPEEIKAKMDDYMARRKSKQPLEYPSAGSTFKRPQGGYASALIEQSGLKGVRVGGAMVSQKHSGFLINAGGATCQDVLDLIKVVQKTVQEKTGFQLECEVERL